MRRNKTRLSAALYRPAMVAAWILIPCIALSQNHPLSLKHGTYVREPYPCKEQPNAAIMSWDGIGFSGAHSSRCASRILSSHGNQFKLSTSCDALGDGSPNPSGRSYVDTFSLTRLSNTRFTLDKTKAPGTYRWCSGEATSYPKEKP